MPNWKKCDIESDIVFVIDVLKNNNYKDFGCLNYRLEKKILRFEPSFSIFKRNYKKMDYILFNHFV